MNDSCIPSGASQDPQDTSKPSLRDELIEEARYYIDKGLTGGSDQDVGVAEQIVDRILQLHKPWTYAEASTAYHTLNDARDRQKTALARAKFDLDEGTFAGPRERRFKHEQRKYDEIEALVYRFYDIVNDTGRRREE